LATASACCQSRNGATTLNTRWQFRNRAVGVYGELCAAGKPEHPTFVITQAITMRASAGSFLEFDFCYFEK
jgi:hypothetical protein